MQGLIECLSAFMACVGFAFIFRVHQNLHFAIIGSLGGALGWLVFLLCNVLHNELASYFIAMTIVTLFAEIAARIYKAPATIFFNYWLLSPCPRSWNLSNNALLYPR